MKSKTNTKTPKEKKLQKLTSVQMFSPVLDVKDGIIITRDGHFVMIMEFAPINFMLRSNAEQTSIISNFAAALKLLPDRVQFKVVSKRADVQSFVDIIRKEKETETNENCRRLQEEQINLIRNVGQARGVSRHFYVVFRYEQKTSFQKKPTFEEIRYNLYDTASRISALLEQCGNDVMSKPEIGTMTIPDDYTLSVLYSIFARSKSEENTFEDNMDDVLSRYLTDPTIDFSKPVHIPPNEFICPNMINTKASSKYIIIDGTYYSFAYLPSQTYPTQAYAGWLSMLIDFGAGVDVDLFVRKENVAAVQRKLQYGIRYNKVKARSTEDTSMDYEEINNAIDAGYYLRDGLANAEDFCYMSILLTISASSLEELKWKKNELKNYLVAHDLKAKFCDFQHEQAFLSSLPLCDWNANIFNKSKRNVLTSSLASAYPFISFEIADPNGIMLGVNKANDSLVFVDNFDTTKYKNANIAILGTSGAGKTYTLQCMALRMREKKTQVFIIAPDKGHEFKRAADAVGGQYIKISAGSSQNINVMEIRKMDTANSVLLDGKSGQKDSILARKIQQLHVFFSLLIPDISHEERQLLDEALIKTYNRFGITSRNKSLIDPSNPTRYRDMPVLGDLHNELKNQGVNSKRLYNILTRYVTGSAKSFNKPTNVDLNNKYIVLDISDLTKELLPVGMFIVVDYVWDKAREDRTAKKAIFLDELWCLIGAKSSPQAAEFVLEIFKVIRGYGGSAIAATQDHNDFFALEDGRFGKGIINNARTKIIMNLEPKEAYSVAEMLDLTPIETQRITNFKRGEGLILANSNHVAVEFKSSQVENDLITTDRQQLAELAERKAREDAYGSYGGAD